MPSRCLTVTGTSTTARIARTASATTSGYAMRQAPKRPRWTRSLGHPTFRPTSSYPQSTAARAASASADGSSPPNCSATGCSRSSYASSRSRSPCTTAAAVTISV